MNVTLNEFLNRASQTLPLLTYLNTDNDTFPADCRFKEINLFTFLNMVNTNRYRFIGYMEIDLINDSPDLHTYIMNNKFNSEIRPVKLSIVLKCTLSNIN